MYHPCLNISWESLYNCNTLGHPQMSPFWLVKQKISCSPFGAFLPHHWLTNTVFVLVQLERSWATCLRCPASDERTTTSTRESLSTRTFCSPTTCRPPWLLEDIRPRQRSSSWPRGSTRCEHTGGLICYLSVSVKNSMWTAVTNSYYFSFWTSNAARRGFYGSSAVLPHRHCWVQRAFPWGPNRIPHPRHGYQLHPVW